MVAERETKECPHCFTEIDARASVCPNCKRDLETSAQAKGEKKQRSVVGRLVRWTAILIILCLVGAVIAVALGGDGDDTAEEAPAAEEEEAAAEIEPTEVPPAPPYSEFAANFDSMTDAQWEAFNREVTGTTVELWTGTVRDVDEGEIFGGFTVFVEMDNEPLNSVHLDVEEDVALSLSLDQEITFSGTVAQADNSLGLTIFVEDVTIH